MKCIGIVAEYNPFHIGHAHQLQQLRKDYPDALIVVAMSGSFVQRGEPAIFNKFIRARWALLNGAHAVIELPTIYATANAERFAAGAIRLLAAMGATAISFGSETTDLQILTRMAQLSTSPSVQSHCQALLKEGLFYGAALRQAMAIQAPEIESLLQQPNALLGVEYIRAIQKYHLNIDVYPLQRDGEHHSETLTNTWPSGSALRHYLYANTPQSIIHDIASYIPRSIHTDYATLIKEGDLLDPKRYEDFILYESRCRTQSELQRLCDFNEGLENRWLQASQAATWADARELLKTKRYSYARLNRMASYTLLNITQELQTNAHHQGPTYARLLGFTHEARPWLQAKNFTIPLIQKWAPFVKQAQGLTAQLARLDQKATDIQQLCLFAPQKRRGRTDYTFTPWYI